MSPRWIGSDWSGEERQTLWLIHAIGMPLFAVSCYAVVMSLFSAGVEPLIVVIVGVVPPYIASVGIARLLAMQIKPDLVSRADESAARRMARKETAGWQ